MNTRIIVLLIAILCLSNSGFAQDTWINKRFTIKTGGGRIYNYSIRGRMVVNNYSSPTSYYPKDESNAKSAYSELCLMYGITRYLEVGIHGGFSPFRQDAFTDVVIPFYGMNVNLHLLPLLLNVKNYRLDIYMASNIGGLYNYFMENGYTDNKMDGRYTKQAPVESGHNLEAGIGLGSAFYITRNIGFYSEITLGKYVSVNKYRWIYGIAIKF